jgi:hypothetical protein
LWSVPDLIIEKVLVQGRQVELPADRLIPALLAFNIGLELGQIILICLFVLPVTKTVQYFPGLRHGMWVDASASALCGLGCFWYLSRNIL